jgi:hypothetical protein
MGEVFLVAFEEFRIIGPLVFHTDFAASAAYWQYGYRVFQN